MWRLLRYYGQFQGFRGNLTGLPRWTLWIIAIFALPGIVLVGLSLIALAISIAALLLLTVPAYRLLSLLAGRRERTAESGSGDRVVLRPGDYVVSDGPVAAAPSDAETDVPVRPRTRQIDVKIVE